MTVQFATYLKKTDVCERLGVSPRTLDNLICKKEFPPPVKIGKWGYWSPATVKDWHERQFAGQEAFFQRQLA